MSDFNNDAEKVLAKAQSLRDRCSHSYLGAAHLAADYLQESLQVSTNRESCSFLPKLSVEDAKNLHQKWQAFLTWCKAQPK